MEGAKEQFVFAVDLDGVVADFYGRMREVVTEWYEVPLERLDLDVSYGLPEWGVPDKEEYFRIHRFALKHRSLFSKMEAIKGAPSALRRLSNEGVRIRIVTYRLFEGMSHAHVDAIVQTVRWLDEHGVPYWDLCFLAEKGDVSADVYIDDGERHIEELMQANKDVIVFSNSTNWHVPTEPNRRADSWVDAERMVRERYYAWRTENGLPLPPVPGQAPARCDSSEPAESAAA